MDVKKKEPPHQSREDGAGLSSTRCGGLCWSGLFLAFFAKRLFLPGIYRFDDVLGGRLV